MVEGSAPLPDYAGPVRCRLSVETPRPEHVRVSVKVDRDVVLILNQRATPGWIARVDGRPARALIADAVLMATVVPAGQHTAEFLYQPRAFVVGRAVTCLAVVAWTFLIVGSLWVRGARSRSGTP